MFDKFCTNKGAEMEPLRMFYQSKVELALRSDLGKQASDFDDVGNQLEQAFPNRLEGPHRAAHTSSGSHSLPAAGQYSIDARVLKDLSLRQVRSEQRIKKVEEALVTIVMQMKIERYERMMGQRDLEQAVVELTRSLLSVRDNLRRVEHSQLELGARIARLEERGKHGAPAEPGKIAEALRVRLMFVEESASAIERRLTSLEHTGLEAEENEPEQAVETVEAGTPTESQEAAFLFEQVDFQQEQERSRHRLAELQKLSELREQKGISGLLNLGPLRYRGSGGSSSTSSFLPNFGSKFKPAKESRRVPALDTATINDDGSAGSKTGSVHSTPGQSPSGGRPPGPVLNAGNAVPEAIDYSNL